MGSVGGDLTVGLQRCWMTVSEMVLCNPVPPPLQVWPLPKFGSRLEEGSHSTQGKQNVQMLIWHYNILIKFLLSFYLLPAFDRFILKTTLTLFCNTSL